MIMIGNARGNGLKLAAHLMNDRDNDHVEIHDLRGFTADSLHGAFQEADAVSKGTRCQQYLFSLSINPPETESVSIHHFEAAIERAEQLLGLQDQARAIVFHEKRGRRHAHVVWSRIDVLEMKAINLPFYKQRLNDVSKDIFLEHGWRLPNGYLDKRNRDPRNFTLGEWQQAKRAGKDAREIKRTFQEAWSVSDGKEAFAHALEEKGYILARGDRGRYVAVDAHGEVYAIPKWTGLKAKQVREKLRDAKELRSVGEAKTHIAETMQPTLSRWQEELNARKQRLEEKQARQRQELIERQRAERERLKTKLETRRINEVRKRQARFRTGLQGLWDHVRGEHSRIRKDNEREAWEAHLRDREVTDNVVFEHLSERRALQQEHHAERSVMVSQREELRKDRARFESLRSIRNGVSRDGPQHER